MILQWLPIPGYWAFVHGVITVPVGGHTVHQTREIAVSRALEDGLVVEADGTVRAAQ